MTKGTLAFGKSPCFCEKRVRVLCFGLPSHRMGTANDETAAISQKSWLITSAIPFDDNAVGWLHLKGCTC